MPRPNINRLPVWDPAVHWVAMVQADEALDGSDKTITVTAGRDWMIQSLRAELTTTATVGNRQIAVQIRDDSDDVIAEVRAGATQTASLTRSYHFGPHLPDLTSFRDTDWISTPIDPLIVPAGYDIRIFDNNAVDAAADDLVVRLAILERDAVT